MLLASGEMNVTEVAYTAGFSIRLLYTEPWTYRNAITGYSLVATINQGGGLQWLVGKAAPPAQAVEHIAGNGLA